MKFIIKSNYPGDYKRFKGNEYGYTFIYPKQWVGDTAVELAKAQRRALTLDYTMKNSKKSTSTLPDSGKTLCVLNVHDLKL